MKIKIEDIRIDGGTQPRAELNEATVGEYAEAMREGAVFPPIAVFHDGSSYWLADGFHRYHAHLRNGAKAIEAGVHRGDRRAAVLFSVGANGQHGLRRSNADKRRAVETVLADDEWKQWSDRRIAETCGVSVSFVSAVRRPEVAQQQQANRTASAVRSVVGLHANDGERRAAASPAHQSPKPAPDIARSDAPDIDDGPTLEELVDELHAENARLTAEIQAAEADDLAAEAVKWRRVAENAQRQQSEAMARAAESQKREKFAMDQLRRCGRAVGVEDPRKIAAAVERMAAQKAAA